MEWAVAWVAADVATSAMEVMADMGDTAVAAIMDIIDFFPRCKVNWQKLILVWYFPFSPSFFRLRVFANS